MPCPSHRTERVSPPWSPVFVLCSLSAPGSALWGTPACSPPRPCWIPFSLCLSQCPVSPTSHGVPLTSGQGGRGQGAWGLEQQQQQAAEHRGGDAGALMVLARGAVAAQSWGPVGARSYQPRCLWLASPVQAAPLVGSAPLEAGARLNGGVPGREGRSLPAWAPAAPPTTRAPLPAEATAGIQEAMVGGGRLLWGPREPCTGRSCQTRPR